MPPITTTRPTDQTYENNPVLAQNNVNQAPRANNPLLQSDNRSDYFTTSLNNRQSEVRKENKLPWYLSFAKEALKVGIIVGASIFFGPIGGIVAGAFTSIGEQLLVKGKIDFGNLLIDTALGAIPGGVGSSLFKGLGAVGTKLGLVTAKKAGEQVTSSLLKQVTSQSLKGTTNGGVIGYVGGTLNQGYENYKETGKIDLSTAHSAGMSSIISGAFGGAIFGGGAHYLSSKLSTLPSVKSSISNIYEKCKEQVNKRFINPPNKTKINTTTQIPIQSQVASGSFKEITTMTTKSGFEKIKPKVSYDEITAKYPDGEVLKSMQSSVEILARNGYQGSGFIICPKGYCLTNAHVVMDAKEVIVYLLNKTPGMIAEVIYVSKKLDLALIKLPLQKQPYHYSIFSTKIPKQGDIVHTIGMNGLTSGQILTPKNTEKISFVPDQDLLERLTEFRSDKNGSIKSLIKLIIDKVTVMRNKASSNPIRPGDSGAKMVNHNGEIIGITHAGKYIEKQATPFINIFSRIQFAISSFIAKWSGIRIKSPGGNITDYCSWSDNKKIFSFLQESGVNINV